MAQFDLHRNRDGGAYPLLLDVQAELLSQLTTRIVVPLATRERFAAPLARATPVIEIDGVDYVLVVPLLAAVQRSILGKVVGNIAARRADIIGALDLVFTGS